MDEAMIMSTSNTSQVTQCCAAKKVVTCHKTVLRLWSPGSSVLQIKRNPP